MCTRSTIPVEQRSKVRRAPGCCVQFERSALRLPFTLTTSAAIVADPAERFRLVEAWEEMPDLVTANQGEPRIRDLCELLLARGVGIEAGLLCGEDARAFVRSGLAGRCSRVRIEPLDADPHRAVQHASEMEDIVVAAGITLEQVHHGYGIACWAVNRRALDRGHGILPRLRLADPAAPPAWRRGLVLRELRTLPVTAS